MADVVLKRHCKLLSFFTIIYIIVHVRKLTETWITLRYARLYSESKVPLIITQIKTAHFVTDDKKVSPSI